MRRVGLLLSVVLAAANAVAASEQVWSGERTISEPLEIRGCGLRLTPGARLIFKGRGKLTILDGGLCAERAEFVGLETATNHFRIAVRNGRIDFIRCRFAGLRAMDPDPERAHYIQGFLCSQGGADARIEGCTFVDCSPVMILNAVRLEAARNLSIRCPNVFSFLDCCECRISHNEFFETSSGLKISGSRLTECFRNRFTDCQTAILVSGCEDGRFVGNAIFGGQVGLRIRGKNARSVFMGNRFESVRQAFWKDKGLAESVVLRDNEVR